MSRRLPPRDAQGRFTSAKDAIQEAKERKLKAAEARREAPKVEFSGDHGTAQIYSQGYEFAFMSRVKGVWKQVCTFVYCKDFLHDAVWAWVNKTKWSIYGFTYDTAKHLPLEAEHTVFAFRNTQFKGKDKEFHAAREACQDFLNQIEAQMGLEPSMIHEVPHPSGPCWLIIGDKGWQHAAPMVGLYTLFIRVGVKHTAGEGYEKTLAKARDGKIKIGAGTSYAGNRDCSYIKQAWDGIQVILKHGLKVFHPTIGENYPKDLPNKCGSLHGQLGPVNFTNARKTKNGAAKAMPYWYRDEIWGK